MAWGQHKAGIVRDAVEGEVTAKVTASFLQEHDNAVYVLDQAAAGALTRQRTPWLLGPLAEQGLAWDERMTRRAILWLSQRCGKAILKLTDHDYNEAGLQNCCRLTAQPTTRISSDFIRCSTRSPAGRAAVIRRGRGPATRRFDLARRFCRSFPKRVLVLSPHPDDDVISMGGTLCRLVEQGHEVHVAY